jgi:4-hydroxyproline epimerase
MPDGEVSVDQCGELPLGARLRVEVPGWPVIGDVAWGGNWFYLVSRARASHRSRQCRGADRFHLCACARRRQCGTDTVKSITSSSFAPSAAAPAAHSRNFVLCPGKAYDRSPCGTGTSAKLACLAADGKLAEDEPWVQESLIGSTFVGRYRWRDRAKGEIVPTITAGRT